MLKKTGVRPDSMEESCISVSFLAKKSTADFSISCCDALSLRKAMK